VALAQFGAGSLALSFTSFIMTLSYKLPKQTPCAIPLDSACTVEEVKDYIMSERQIALPFKLRIFIRGQQVFLKASQTLEEVVAMGAEVISVMYYDQAAMKSARRKLAKDTAALVRVDVREDGDKTRDRIRDSAEDIKAYIRTELMTSSSGARRTTGLKSKLAGKKVLAASPDHEMGDSTYEICHSEQQTWADGAKHTVCIIKSEGKPSLSREFSSLLLHDPFIARDATHSVRVVVVPHQVEHAQFHTGWRGMVQAAKATAQNVKVNFPLLKMGRIVHVGMLVPKTALRVLGDDDISMTPNRHPWLGRKVTALETGHVGEIVDVNNKGRVRFRVDGRKGVLFIETKSSSFEALFSEEPAEAQVSPDPPPAAEVEAPQQPQAVEVDPTDSQEAAQSLADSDAESERAAPTPGSNEPVEPTSAPAKRGKGKKQPAKATAVKRRPASSNVSSAPASKRRRNSFSLGNVD
jgi:hypothetical protein